jgi:cytochrome b involved in lipid metabolism
MDESNDRNYDEKPLLVYVKDRLYDVAKFAKKHPGGSKVLRRVAGEHIDKYMLGEERILGVKHQHSAAAMGILERYSVNEQQKEVGGFSQGEHLIVFVRMN